MEKNLKIGLAIIATNKYKQFVLPFLLTADKHFFKMHKLEVYLFTDDFNYYENSLDELSFKVKLIQIPPYKFPYATLYRYEIFTSYKYEINCNWLFYSDVDMAFVADIGEEILPSADMEQIIAVRHCGFYAKGGGSWEANKNSFAYVSPEKRINYWAGGFQGGEKDTYLKYAKCLSYNISKDEDNGIIPVWHDESAWNWLLSDLKNFKGLTPDYCMVEETENRIAWGVNNFEPKLIALKKNHEEIRK